MNKKLCLSVRVWRYQVNACATSTITPSTILPKQLLMMPHFPNIEACYCYTMTPQQIKCMRLVVNLLQQYNDNECSDDDDARSIERHQTYGRRRSEGLTSVLWCFVCLSVCFHDSKSGPDDGVLSSKASPLSFHLTVFIRFQGHFVQALASGEPHH